jgi:CRISPR/Cas system CSM-associated protein Csm2 small subunit
LGKIRYILADFTELGMEYASIAILIGSALASASVLLGAKYQQGKGKAKQLAELLTTIIEAAQDDEVTEKEFQKIVSSAKDLLQKPEAEPS